MPPHLVQEANDSRLRNKQEQFAFVLCQQGAEAAIKRFVLATSPFFRLAFSRPGLLTFKCPPAGESPPGTTGELPEHCLIRLAGWTLGTVRGTHTAPMIQQALQLGGSDWDAIHLFPRDTGLPGQQGFEPGHSELTDAIAQQFSEAIPGDSSAINTICDFGTRVLDVVIVEPHQWLVGHHHARKPHERWPGGVYPLSAPPELISRAYLKMAEAVAWSGLPLRPGDRIVEIGSAPGGACQRLLDLGLIVTGVDAAEMDPLLLAHPRFEHWRSKTAGVRRKLFAKFRWLAADANVTPNYTLDFVEDIVNYKTSRFEGLLLTLKLSTYDLMEQLPAYAERIRSWGFERVEMRQLGSNRRECCVVAERHKSSA